ncbi:MAG: 2-C-methyl-D-erythritol 4-phosphate cytidylyltransferase [Planctomycetaceae bacterium]
MVQFAVILPAAGKSNRFGDSLRKKVFVDLAGRAVWARSAEAFSHRKDVVQTILVVSPDDEGWFREKFQASLLFMNVEVVCGGDERADSVCEGLKRVRDDVDFVAVHDAARPLIAARWIDEVFEAATKSDAAILATRVTNTVKRVNDGTIVETVDRSQLWGAQTPQVFRKHLLLDAYAAREGRTATDEAELVEWFGHPVSIVEGSPINMKITTQDDLQVAAALLNSLPASHLPESLSGDSPNPSKQPAPPPGLW